MLSTAVVSENSVRDYRSRSVAIIGIDHHLDAIRCQHLHGAGKSGLGKRVRIHAYVEWSVDALLLAIEANRLRYCKNVRLIEGVVERGASMTGSSKRDALRRYCWIGSPRVIRGDQTRDIDQQRWVGRLACKWRDRHWCSFGNSKDHSRRTPSRRIGSMPKFSIST